MNLFEINDAFPQIFQAFFFCIGACVGSFLNVCIYRIPAGKSIVNPPSHCACGAPIQWYNNIPIFSWFCLRGRAKCCGRKIAFRYPLVEALTAFIFLGMWCLLPPQTALVGMFFASIMIFCAFVDLDTMMLPDFATVGGIIIGFIISVAMPQLHIVAPEGAPLFAKMVSSAVSSAVGIIVGAGVISIMRIFGECVFGREAMGEGDIILAACIGAFCGWQGAIFAIFGGSVIGAVLMIPIIILANLFKGKKAPKRPIEGDKSDAAEKPHDDCDAAAIPFGPWLAIGALLYFMFFSKSLDAYLANFVNVLF